VASRSCLIVISAAILLSLAGCSSGSSGGGNPPPPQNPAPAISSITPPTATAGAAGVTINVSGSGLVSTSAVAWNGASLATTLSGNQLSATIPLADLAAAGAVQITVVNPSPGGGTSNPLAFVIQGTQALPAPAFVYVGNSVGSISVFSVDPTTGSLTEVPGSPFQENVGAYSMTADPTGNFLYLGTVGGGTLQQAANDLFGFAIDSPTGVLTPVSGSPFPAEPGIENSIAIDPSGKFLYVAGLDYNSVDSISEFSINPTTGELTSISQVGCLGAPFGPEPAMYGPSYSVAVDPAEGFLLSLGQFNEVCTFSIGSSGVLQQVAGLPLVLDPNAILLNSAELAIDPSGKFGYTANGDFTISAFSIAPGSGALSELPGSPFTIQDPNAAGSVWIQMDPLDRFLWESDSSGNLTAYSINTSTGELTLLAGFPPSSSLGFASSTPLAVDPSGKFLYELNFSSGTSNQEVLISGYTIDESSGVLTAVSGSPFQLNLPANATPFTVTVSPKSQ
jgi:6-phosphogluconolactonase (cycloisomerase 2 family)